MLGHELFQNVLLLHFVCGGQAHLLLALVEHHLLDDASGLSIKVGQLRVLGLDLASVDVGVALDDRAPPRLLVLLGQRQLQEALALLVSLDAPQTVTLLHLLVEGTVNDQGLALQAHLQVALLDIDSKLLARSTLRDGDVDGELA